MGRMIGLPDVGEVTEGDREYRVGGVYMGHGKWNFSHYRESVDYLLDWAAKYLAIVEYIESKPDPAVEAVAKALCQLRQWNDLSEAAKEGYRRHACTAIEAYKAAKAGK